MEPLGLVERLAGVAVALLAGCGSSPSREALVLPTITERFTPLPCPHRPETTIAIEGCAERKILATDEKIREKEQAYFSGGTPSYRRRWVRSERAWLAHRTKVCTAAAARFSGGTLEAAAFAECVLSENLHHLSFIG